MSRQQRRADIDRIIRQLARHLQHFLFGFGVQTVSGFDFKGGHAFIHQPLQPLLRQRQQGFGELLRVAVTVALIPPPWALMV
jgi:hypothetical protein